MSVIVSSGATGPRGATGPTAPVINSIDLLRTSDLSAADSVLIPGYYGIGTQGGGLFVYDADAGVDNGGTVIVNVPSGRPYTRVNYTGSVYEWGAFCDATQVSSPGSIASGTNVFTAPFVIPASFVGKKIAITGAGPSGTTLGTTITGIDVTGLIITLADNAQTKAPLFYPTAAKAIAAAGAGYAQGDTSVMSDGSTVLFTSVDGSGAVQNFVVTAQPAGLNAAPVGNLTQVSTSGVGAGFTGTLTYNSTGSYVYSSDDSAAINAALVANSSGKYACDTYIPENSYCGVASTIVISGGRGHLRGFDRWHNGLIAVAPMNRVFWRDLSGGFGGGLHDLSVDAFGLAPAATEQSNGRYFIWENILHNNATLHGHMASGTSTDANGGTVYNNCFARIVFSTLPSTLQGQKYGFDFQSQGGPAFMSNIDVSGVCTADPVGDPSKCINVQTTGIHITTTNMFGASPYAPTYGVDAGKQCTLVGVQIGGATKAAVRVAGPNVTCVGTYAQWGNSNYQDPANSHGVIIEATGSPFFVDNCTVTNTTCDKGLNAANIVSQNGSSGLNNIVQNNAGASYVYPPNNVTSGAPWAQPATNAYANAALVAGGVPMGSVLFNALDAFFASVSAALLARMDGLYFVANIDEPTALVNMANPSGLALVKHGGLTFTKYRGYVGDGVTGYLDTQLNTNALVNWQLNSASMMVWTGSPSVSLATSYSIGTSQGGRSRIIPRDNVGNMSSRSQENTLSNTVASSADSIGSFGWSRPGSASAPGYTQYIDGAPVAHPVTAAITKTNGNAWLLADNTAFTTRPIAAAMIGGNFSDAEISVIDAAMKTLLTAVGAPT